MVLFLVYARLISRCDTGFLSFSVNNTRMKTRGDAAGAPRIIHYLPVAKLPIVEEAWERPQFWERSPEDWRN